jgi:hypothetical protein
VRYTVAFVSGRLCLSIYVHTVKNLSTEQHSRISAPFTTAVVDGAVGRVLFCFCECGVVVVWRTEFLVGWRTGWVGKWMQVRKFDSQPRQVPFFVGRVIDVRYIHIDVMQTIEERN